MSDLTAYDTGARAEPKLWPGQTGKVDFDNDESATVATVWIDRTAAGEFVLHTEAGNSHNVQPLPTN